MTHKFIAAILSIASLAGVLFAIDARYLHAEDGQQMEERTKASVKELKIDIERLRLGNELSSQRAKLSFLANKSKLTADERLELDWIRDQVKLLQARIAVLQ